jgi:hypothetical protein
MSGVIVAALVAIGILVPMVSTGAWRAILRWLHVLWVSRVSVASVAAGFALFVFASPAQDLLADTSFGYVSWSAFFALLLLCWAFPVHYAARRLLERQEWAVSNRLQGPQRALRVAALQAAYETPITWVPRALGLACFVAVGLGLWAERQNLKSATNIDEVAQAIGSMNKLLIANVAVAVLFGAIILVRAPLMSRAGGPRAPLGLSDFASLSLYNVLYLGRLRALRASSPGYFAVAVLAIGAAAVSTVAFGFAFVDPFLVAKGLPRALFLVFMLGGGVLGWTYVAAWSHRLRTPLLLLVAVALVTVATYSPRFHDVRVSSERRPSPDRQVPFTEAVRRWASANQCSVETINDARSCPSPIIVAGQGGASRAAYVTLTTVGELLDRTRSPAPQPGGTAPVTPRDFARQAFALSTVSGSSAGAVMLRAALLDSETEEAWRAGPCKQVADALWFGSSGPDTGVPPTGGSGWRTCLQRLAVGDFLSPVFVGIAMRDVTSVRRWFYGDSPWWADRADLLERAWEHRYDTVVPPKSSSETGLARRFGYIRAFWRDDDPRRAWTPLLFLNGTSVETGRRILTSDVRAWDCEPGGKQGVFSYMPEAYDVFEVLGSGKSTFRVTPRCPADASADPPMASDLAPDFPLSTAGTMSARFPLISPAGQLRNRDGNVVDRIVDGGYFENDGMATANDIAQVLIRFGLTPVVVRVTNDPVPPVSPSPTRTWLDARPEPSPTLPDAEELSWLPTLSTSARGLLNTRTGHGGESAHAIVETVANAARARDCSGECPPHYIHIAVREAPPEPNAAGDQPYLRKISMSWWLSQPLQAYLEKNVLLHNKCDFDAVMWHLTPGPDGTRKQAYEPPASCPQPATASPR